MNYSNSFYQKTNYFTALQGGSMELKGSGSTSTGSLKPITA